MKRAYIIKKGFLFLAKIEWKRNVYHKIFIDAESEAIKFMTTNDAEQLVDSEEGEIVEDYTYEDYEDDDIYEDD
ncbi:MAG: hypothetical protein ACYDAO_09330 [Thermoplasmataceae archaeon]